MCEQERERERENTHSIITKRECVHEWEKERCSFDEVGEKNHYTCFQTKISKPTVQAKKKSATTDQK